jgi:hypothetical protein
MVTATHRSYHLIGMSRLSRLITRLAGFSFLGGASSDSYDQLDSQVRHDARGRFPGPRGVVHTCPCAGDALAARGVLAGRV